MPTKRKQETNTPQAIEHKCSHCGSVFVRENSLFKHVCEKKRRFMDKDRPANRIAYGAWEHFYSLHHPSKRNLAYTDFSNNLYYTAFVRFGIYCTEVKVINPKAYSIYLIKNQVPIDNWNSDISYTKYLIDYLKAENCLDAVRRSIEYMMDIAQEENIPLCDTFRYVNSNKICHMICTGKISPWILYKSNSGIEFLSKLNRDQTNMVFDYIDPERWNIKFKHSPDDVSEVLTVINGIPGL